MEETKKKIRKENGKSQWMEMKMCVRFIIPFS